MRLTFVTAGSRGDVQPLVALARGAKAGGFDVRVAAHPLFEDLVRRTGLDYFALPGQSPKEIWADESKATVGGRGPLRYVGTLKKVLTRKGPDRQSLGDLVDACRGADAVVYSHASVVAYHIAEHFGVAAVAAFLYPSLPSSSYPSILTPPGRVRSATYNAATHLVVHQTFWMVDRPWVNRWRRDDLSLRSLRAVPALNYRFGRGGLVLHGFSPSVVARPRDWPSNAHITGYWSLDEGANWSPPGELERFLSAGPPPVCVTFGSEVDANPVELYTRVFDAVERIGARAVLVIGWADRDRLPRSDRVVVVDSAPYDWLFPRVSCVVHHAGTGTVGEILRAGRPSVCVPFHGEQRYWADLLEARGVASRPIPRSRLDADALATALRTVTTDESIRANAEALGAKIRAERGIERAVDLMSAHLGAPARVS